MNKYILVCLPLVVLLNCKSINAQFGTIKGTLTDEESGESLIGANILLEGTTLGASSDIDGNYLIEGVKTGLYTLKISYVGYQAEVIFGILIKERETITISKKLRLNAKELVGANIIARRITNTENAVLAEMRGAEQVTNGVSSQQIAKTQDRSATDVIRRIPGISIVEDRFVMVRGLSERYNVVLLNDAVAPSVEPDRKAFSFDLLPSVLLDRVVIYKTSAPELPGDFAGGVIKVYTKNIPDENILQAGYSVSYRQGTTFKTFYQSPVGKYDWLGMDGGVRALPGNFPSSINNYSGEQLATYGKSLQNDWLPAQQTASPDSRINLLFARSMHFGKIKVGTVNSLSYTTVEESRYRSLTNYESFDEHSGKTSASYIYNDTLCAQKVNIGIISNWSFILNDKTTIKFYNFFNQSGVNQALIREGDNFDAGSHFKNYGARYNHRTIYSGQLAGSHDLKQGDTKIDWLAGINFGNTIEPDFRRFQTVRDINAPDTTEYYLVVPSSASLESLGRFYSELHEESFSSAVNLVQQLKINYGKWLPKLKS